MTNLLVRKAERSNTWLLLLIADQSTNIRFSPDQAALRTEHHPAIHRDNRSQLRPDVSWWLEGVSDLSDPATTSPDELQDQCKARLLTVANSISGNPVRADSGLSRWRAGTDVSGKRKFRGVYGWQDDGPRRGRER